MINYNQRYFIYRQQNFNFV